MTRRSLLTLGISAIQTLIAACVAVPAIRFLSSPLRRQDRRSAPVRVAPLEALPIGTPLHVNIIAQRRDAYTTYPPAPIGSVWLLRTGDVPNARVLCLQTICPHLGCAIEHAPDRGVFTCPCHASDFDLRGRRLNGPSPRDMDELDCRVSDADPTGTQWIEVRYGEFRVGITTPIPVT